MCVSDLPDRPTLLGLWERAGVGMLRGTRADTSVARCILVLCVFLTSFAYNLIQILVPIGYRRGSHSGIFSRTTLSLLSYLAGSALRTNWGSLSIWSFHCPRASVGYAFPIAPLRRSHWCISETFVVHGGVRIFPVTRTPAQPSPRCRPRNPCGWHVETIWVGR